jgi:hypothetical protein
MSLNKASSSPQIEQRISDDEDQIGSNEDDRFITYRREGDYIVSTFTIETKKDTDLAIFIRNGRLQILLNELNKGNHVLSRNIQHFLIDSVDEEFKRYYGKDPPDEETRIQTRCEDPVLGMNRNYCNNAFLPINILTGEQEVYCNSVMVGDAHYPPDQIFFTPSQDLMDVMASTYYSKTGDIFPRIFTLPQVKRCMEIFMKEETTRKKVRGVEMIEFTRKTAFKKLYTAKLIHPSQFYEIVYQHLAPTLLFTTPVTGGIHRFCSPVSSGDYTDIGKQLLPISVQYHQLNTPMDRPTQVSLRKKMLKCVLCNWQLTIPCPTIGPPTYIICVRHPPIVRSHLISCFTV